MTTTSDHSLSLLHRLALPNIDGHVDWDGVTTDQLHDIIRGASQMLSDREPNEPTTGVLQRSLQLEETARALQPLQHRYAGLLQDAFKSPKLRVTIDLPTGKTPFRDANDLIAKTHGLRAYEASGRTRLAAAMTPVRASDPDRDDKLAVGETKLPLLGALQAQGKLHPSKLSAALSMLDEVDKNAEDAGKDKVYRDKLRSTTEQDLVKRIERSTPEEFSRFVSRRKKDLLASIDPPGKKFTKQQTDAMHGAWCEGPVRGNPDAYKWSVITDAEGNEVMHAVDSMANNPRAKDDEFDTRTRGQRSMHAIRDALKFALANRENAEFRGASGSHTQMVVLADYPTLMQSLRDELAELLPEIHEDRREKLLVMLAEAELDEDIDAAELGVPARKRSGAQTIDADGTEITVPPSKTTEVEETFDDDDLERLQPRISQGIYTPYIPPQVLMRLLCDVSVSPVTLTGQRQILSVGQKQRQFTEAMRRGILARDRGCIVPGCHWPAAWCELHHIQFWSQNGETSTENGAMLCSHHHQALHAEMLHIERVNGEIRCRLHPLIDPDQELRKNYFWQT